MDTAVITVVMAIITTIAVATMAITIGAMAIDAELHSRDDLRALRAGVVVAVG